MQGDLCPEGGLCPGVFLSGRSIHTVKSRRYVSYWNAFLFENKKTDFPCDIYPRY